jgi:hypothetical protein
MSAQADDTWMAGFVMPTSAPADDDDYLPSEQQVCREQLLARHIVAIEGQRSGIADPILIRGEARRGAKLSGYSTLLSLYILMSLQR